MSSRLRAAVSRARVSLPGLLELAGAVLLAYSGWLIYEPAGYAVAGLLALLKVYELERK